jgi:3-phenylpropionate/cinnamic acid dioxygenase small subunit
VIASDRDALRDLQYDVEQFLYYEADLIDERRLDDWLTLLADDLEYWMPVRSTRARGDEDNEFAKPGESAFFDDDKDSMQQRVRKLHTGFAWAEDPPSRTRHVVSNVRIVSTANDLIEVRCNFMLYRSRLAADEDLWVGRREDRLRRNGESFQIARRHIYLDHVSLDSKNLSVFF